MQSEAHLNEVLLLYLFLLFGLVITKIIDKMGIIDVSYLIVLLCSMLKVFLIAKKDRK